ncbi:hypothetical protein [Kribbella sp. NPDC051718]|uniref:hypothetical protein n=1 Tax=Kribbella sp. NPDC051718 TaxID=3155168 RepID=UPI00341B77C3
MRMLLRYAYGVVPVATVATLLLALASAGSAAVLNLLIGRVVGHSITPAVNRTAVQFYDMVGFPLF